ncbi:MAG TPA: winged helix DNA-binding domain-containing protein [Kouleothrix sp.]|nr:winged helix DNA-binding domain-containing protein [Kouleothrix sp.]HRC75429.1 winged helix DNA-binding domain-containing protein [Kouleothrix sp.]
MTIASVGDIALARLASQHIAHPGAARAAEAVARLGAVQAQDYLGALWAVGLRTPGATEPAIEQALAEREIVRTWPMRGTLHIVAAADARWMLELLASRVVSRSGARRRELGIDAAALAASAKVVAGALVGGRQLTRSALYEQLEQAGIATGGSRGLHILGYLAHERLICFGARAGKQPTFVLLEEWLPAAPALARDEALAMLALRYFTGHGPATVQDLTWWAGLTLGEARAAIGSVAGQLARATVGGQEYFFAPGLAAGAADPAEAFLLPPFDEFLVGYRDRSAMLDPAHTNLVTPGSNGIFNPIVVIGGRVLGTWKRAFAKKSVVLSFSAFAHFSAGQARAIEAAAERYAAFLGLPAEIQIEHE